VSDADRPGPLRTVAPGPTQVDTASGAVPRAQLRSWFSCLADQTRTINVEGRATLVLLEDVDELLATEPVTVEDVYLLPGFDQYLLGPGTADTALVPSQHRALVSRPGAWISPVVISAGRVVGTWKPVDESPHISLFPGIEIPPRALGHAVDAMATLLANTPETSQDAEPR
jgi:hypothetical protein